MTHLTLTASRTSSTVEPSQSSDGSFRLKRADIGGIGESSCPTTAIAPFAIAMVLRTARRISFAKTASILSRCAHTAPTAGGGLYSIPSEHSSFSMMRSPKFRRSPQGRPFGSVIVRYARQEAPPEPSKFIGSGALRMGGRFSHPDAPSGRDRRPTSRGAPFRGAFSHFQFISQPSREDGHGYTRTLLRMREDRSARKDERVSLWGLCGSRKNHRILQALRAAT